MRSFPVTLKWSALPIMVALLWAVAHSEVDTQGGGDIHKIHWVDGDSGRINGERFRLSAVDAPETAPVSAGQGANCPLERERGFAARQFMQQLTDGRELEYRILEEDRFGRKVVQINREGEDVAALGLAAGHLQPWPHDQGRPLAPKPNWCVP